MAAVKISARIIFSDPQMFNLSRQTTNQNQWTRAQRAPGYVPRLRSELGLHVGPSDHRQHCGKARETLQASFEAWIQLQSVVGKNILPDSQGVSFGNFLSADFFSEHFGKAAACQLRLAVDPLGCEVVTAPSDPISGD